MSSAAGASSATALPPHAVDARELVQVMQTSASEGLTHQRARELAERHGPNQLPEEEPIPWWRQLLGQFTDLIIWILIGAAVVAALLGDWIESAVIMAIVILNGVLGFVQERRAVNAITALRKLSAPQCKVLRDGQVKLIPAAELVPGDIVEMEAGDFVPADVRLLTSSAFRTQEAALTGESVPVDKKAGAVLSEDTPLGDRVNMAFMGTVVAAGQASGIVVYTALLTQLGHIAGLLRRHEPEPTPLQRRLAELGRKLLIVVVVLVAIIFALELIRGGGILEVFLISVSLAVAAVPEGLPAVVTIALALGMQRMAKRNALIRSLPSVETLGSVTVVCSDKTGTLTQNQMTVRRILAGERVFELTGRGYAPEGQFMFDGEPADAPDFPDLIELLRAGAWCNHARLVAPDELSQRWRIVGDPTEGALVVAAHKAGITADHRADRILHEIPFDSERKLMSVVIAADKRMWLYAKGAPEVVLGRCSQIQIDGQIHTLDDAHRERVLSAAAEMAQQAMRVLALARKPVASEASAATEQELIFLGLAAMIDPPRRAAGVAVGKAVQAGVKPVMITGDHPQTAIAIARELRIATENDTPMTGAELDKIDDEQLGQRVEQTSVYARVTAEHKMRIIKAWRSRDQVIAMTGDGVNDAPAIKTADIGIAMGITGTDVTREASDIILTDDNFASIINAIEEGRGIFANIRKFVQYLLSCNAGEVLFMFVAALFGLPLPLFAIQILWINLVTDALPALALGIEPTEPDVMRQRPRPRSEPVISVARAVRIVWHGILIAGVTLAGYWMTLSFSRDLVLARTVAFCIMAYSQLFYSVAVRSDTRTLPELGVLSNPWLPAAIALSGLLQLAVVEVPWFRPLFDASPDLTWHWGMIIGLSLIPATIVELTKLFQSRMRRDA